MRQCANVPIKLKTEIWELKVNFLIDYFWVRGSFALRAQGEKFYFVSTNERSECLHVFTPKRITFRPYNQYFTKNLRSKPRFWIFWLPDRFFGKIGLNQILTINWLIFKYLQNMLYQYHIITNDFCFGYDESVPRWDDSVLQCKLITHRGREVWFPHSPQITLRSSGVTKM